MIGRKPDLVCIGTQKAATTWFYDAMKRRSDIWAPPFKEVHFFDYKFLPENRAWIEASLIKGIDQARARHLKNQDTPDAAYLDYLDALLVPPAFNGTWYKRVFSRAPRDRICFEATPEYCTLPEDGVDFVAKYLKETRFVWIIRDPLDWALSQIRMAIRRRGTGAPKGPKGWDALVNSLPITQRGDYACYVPRWKARFDDRRLLFLPYGLVSADPARLIRRVEDFANLDRVATPGLTDRVHASRPVDIPDAIRDRLADALQPQRQFLLREFGAEFCAET